MLTNRPRLGSVSQGGNGPDICARGASLLPSRNWLNPALRQLLVRFSISPSASSETATAAQEGDARFRELSFRLSGVPVECPLLLFLASIPLSRAYTLSDAPPLPLGAVLSSTIANVHSATMRTRVRCPRPAYPPTAHRSVLTPLPCSPTQQSIATPTSSRFRCPQNSWLDKLP